MPNQPKTRAYAIRIDDELHARLMHQALIEGSNFSEVARNAFDAYLGNEPSAPAEEQLASQQVKKGVDFAGDRRIAFDRCREAHPAEHGGEESAGDGQ